MADSVLFHNPACSKSRAALALIAASGLEPMLRDYLEWPPSTDEIQRLVAMLGVPERELLRGDDPEFTALGLDEPGVSPQRLIEAIATHPRLLQRPIFVHGGRAVIARPPERVLELL